MSQINELGQLRWMINKRMHVSAGHAKTRTHLALAHTTPTKFFSPVTLNAKLNLFRKKSLNDTQGYDILSLWTQCEPPVSSFSGRTERREPVEHIDTLREKRHVMLWGWHVTDSSQVTEGMGCAVLWALLTHTAITQHDCRRVHCWFTFCTAEAPAQSCTDLWQTQRWLIYPSSDVKTSSGFQTTWILLLLRKVCERHKCNISKSKCEYMSSTEDWK